LSNQGVRQITALAKSLAGTEFGLRPAPASFLFLGAVYLRGQATFYEEQE